MLNRRHRSHKATPRRSGTGEVVYFIRAGNAVRFGRTTNLAARLKALATAKSTRRHARAGQAAPRARGKRSRRG
jgi:hypothetical protein